MALIYRAHFAMIKNPLITADGRHTSAIFGFFNSIFKLLRDESPEYFAVVLDCKEPTFRHKMYKEYKATREKMPEELVEQIQPILDFLNSLLQIVELSSTNTKNAAPNQDKFVKRYTFIIFLLISRPY